MPLTLLAILLAFAAPAPLIELQVVLEDEAILDGPRCGKIIRRREAYPLRPIVELPSPASSVQADPEIPWRPAPDGTPRLFSRPPPF